MNTKNTVKISFRFHIALKFEIKEQSNLKNKNWVPPWKEHLVYLFNDISNNEDMPPMKWNIFLW